MFNANDDTTPTLQRTLLIAATTALVTTLATKFAERFMEHVWPRPKEEPKQ